MKRKETRVKAQKEEKAVAVDLEMTPRRTEKSFRENIPGV